MYTLIITLHVALAIVLIISILVFQTSKGSALSMFGGGGDALFNAASGTSFIKKFTAVCAGLFAMTSLLLTIYGSSNRFRSKAIESMQEEMQRQPAPAAAPANPAPAQPAAPAAPAPAKK